MSLCGISYCVYCSKKCYCATSIKSFYAVTSSLISGWPSHANSLSTPPLPLSTSVLSSSPPLFKCWRKKHSPCPSLDSHLLPVHPPTLVTLVIHLFLVHFLSLRSRGVFPLVSEYWLLYRQPNFPGSFYPFELSSYTHLSSSSKPLERCFYTCCVLPLLTVHSYSYPTSSPTAQPNSSSWVCTAEPSASS